MNILWGQRLQFQNKMVCLSLKIGFVLANSLCLWWNAASCGISSESSLYVNESAHSGNGLNAQSYPHCKIVHNCKANKFVVHFLGNGIIWQERSSACTYVTKWCLEHFCCNIQILIWYIAASIRTRKPWQHTNVPTHCCWSIGARRQLVCES